MSTVIHHPNCDVQSTAVGHEDGGCCRQTTEIDDKISEHQYPDWPKGMETPQPPQATQEPQTPASTPEGGLGQPAEHGLGTAPPQPLPAAAPGNGSGPTSAQQWKSDSVTTELVVPSGHVCLCKKPGGMSMFLQKGMIPNDLIPIVKQHMDDGREVDMKKIGEEMLDDPARINDILDLCDNVVLHTVVEPRVCPTPKFTAEDSNKGRIPFGQTVGDVMPVDFRDSNLLYVDEVDIEDKMFIFQWAVGGTRDVATFRSQQASLVADLPTVEGLGAEAK